MSSYSANPPLFKNEPMKFLLYLLLIPVFGLGLFILLWWYIESKNTKLIIDENSVEYHRGIFNKTFVDIYKKDIRTARVESSFFQRIFGVGDVLLFTAGDEPEVILKGFEHPEQLKKLVMPE